MKSFQIAYFSDKGARHEINQDSFFVKKSHYREMQLVSAGVCDGMGGLAEGEKISGAAAAALSGWTAENLRLIAEGDDGTVCRALTEKLDRLNARINGYNGRRQQSAGTTCVLLLLTEDRFTVCNVGDSRCYRLREGELVQLSRDHSLAAQLVEAGLLKEHDVKAFPQRNVLTQAIGTMSGIVPAFASGEAACGDAFLLCCDGFYNELSETELLALYGTEADSASMKEKLRAAAGLARQRGETDDITAILVKIKCE